MLFSEINEVITGYQKDAFTGHLKFGIEKSAIVSFSENSRLEKSEKENSDFGRQLARICSNPNFYGSIEFDLILGKVERLHYCMSFNGQSLKDKLRLK